MGKENNIKEKFKLALISTANAISDDFYFEKHKLHYLYFHYEHLSFQEYVSSL